MKPERQPTAPGEEVQHSWPPAGLQPSDFLADDPARHRMRRLFWGRQAQRQPGLVSVFFQKSQNRVADYPGGGNIIRGGQCADAGIGILRQEHRAPDRFSRTGGHVDLQPV